jgi:hypothetical protein
VATCTFHIGNSLSLRNTTYLVQTQSTVDYLPGTGTGSIT